MIADGTPDEVFTPDILNATYRGDMMVVRHEGLIFVQERPHSHNYHDVAIEPPIDSAIIDSIAEILGNGQDAMKEVEHA